MGESISELAATARRIMSVNTAYFQSRALQSAVELGLFELLEAGPATADQISAQLGIRPDMAPDLLDSLTGLELLDRADGMYSVPAGVAPFLVRS